MYLVSTEDLGREVAVPEGKRQDMTWVWLVVAVVVLGLLFFFVGPQIAG
jgi:hypothetical protein